MSKNVVNPHSVVQNLGPLKDCRLLHVWELREWDGDQKRYLFELMMDTKSYPCRSNASSRWFGHMMPSDELIALIQIGESQGLIKDTNDMPRFSHENDHRSEHHLKEQGEYQPTRGTRKPKRKRDGPIRDGGLSPSSGSEPGVRISSDECAHFIKPNDDVFAKDRLGNWCEAKVRCVDLDAQCVTVHFKGWNKRWDIRHGFGADAVRSTRALTGSPFEDTTGEPPEPPESAGISPEEEAARVLLQLV